MQQTNRRKQLIPAAWEKPTNKNTERTKSKYNAGLRINRTEQLCIKITMAYSTLPWNTNYINYRLISHFLSHSNRIKLQQHWRSQVYLGAFKAGIKNISISYPLLMQCSDKIRQVADTSTNTAVISKNSYRVQWLITSVLQRSSISWFQFQFIFRLQALLCPSEVGPTFTFRSL